MKAEDDTDKKAFIPTQSENEGICESSPALAGSTGLILLLAEKCSGHAGADERSRTGILTSSFEPRSRLPGLPASGPGSL